MKKFSLTAIGRRHLQTAQRVASGRSANTVYGGHEHVLRQTVIALVGGKTLKENLNPGEATVFVLRGRIRLATEADSWDGSVGDLLIVPRDPYSVAAVEDSIVLLTVAKTDRAYKRSEQLSSDRNTADTQLEGSHMFVESGPQGTEKPSLSEQTSG